jgi:hypothetical protein
MTDEHRWGEPIATERQVELDGNLKAWADEEPAAGGAGHGERAGPFAGEMADKQGVSLTGADVTYLADRALAETQWHLLDEWQCFSVVLPYLHLETLYRQPPS